MTFFSQSQVPWKEPFDVFSQWYGQAQKTEPSYPDAMCLSTQDENHRVSSRIVLMKSFNEEGFIFYSHYQSNKAKEISHNKNVSICFHWKSLEKSVRIEGEVSVICDELSDEYFASRPRSSQIGAWASKQSEMMPHADALKERIAFFEEKFHNQPVPRPDHWGGFIVCPQRIEFWEEKPWRLHVRHVFNCVASHSMKKSWRVEQVFP